eukprot:scaffold2177_cov136-Skeletonema_menzelii.AAC.1
MSTSLPSSVGRAHDSYPNFSPWLLGQTSCGRGFDPHGGCFIFAPQRDMPAIYLPLHLWNLQSMLRLAPVVQSVDGFRFGGQFDSLLRSKKVGKRALLRWTNSV